MRQRGFLIGSEAFGTVLAGVMLGAFAAAPEQRCATAAAVGSCEA